MSIAKLFWGLVLITIGVLILLANLGVLPGGFWVSLWQYWPLLLVIIGLSVMFKKKGGAGAWIFFSISVVLITAVGLLSYYYPTDTKLEYSEITFEEDLGQAEELTLRVDFGAGDLTIAGSELMLIEGDANTYTETNLTRTGKSDAKVVVDQKPLKGWFFLNPEIYTKKNEVNLKVTDHLPVDLAINTGASSFDLDLEDVMLTKLNLDFGASDGTIKIGDKVADVDMEIDTGASSLKLILPEGFGIKVESSSGASSNNFSDVGLSRNDDIWKSDGYDDAENQIKIDISMGASSIEIELY